MKLADYRTDFYTFSGKASDFCRQLAFAGIALIWVFKSDGIRGPTLPDNLTWPAALIVLALAFDLTHYLVASCIWRSFYRGKEKAGVTESDDTLSHDPALELPIWLLFIFKIAAVSAAYFFLLAYLWQHL